MCLRDILFGTSTRLTGIKQNYQTNRHRSFFKLFNLIYFLAIQYSITILLTKFSSDWRESLISNLAKNFEVEKSRVSDEETFIYVFYRPRKYFTDYFPLFVAYFLCSVSIFSSYIFF